MAVSTSIIKIGKSVSTQIGRSSRVVTEITPAIKELAPNTVELTAKKAKNTTEDLHLNFFQRVYKETKNIFQVIKEFGDYRLETLKKIPEMRKNAQDLVDSIDDKTWNKMSRAIFRNSAHTNTPFVKSLKHLKSFCKKNNIELSEEVTKSIQVLSEKGKLFAQKMNEALSKGLNPQNKEKYTLKFVKINQKEFDTIKKFIEKLDL